MDFGELKRKVVEEIETNNFKGTIQDYAEHFDLEDDHLISAVLSDLEDEGVVSLIGYVAVFREDGGAITLGVYGSSDEPFEPLEIPYLEDSLWQEGMASTTAPQSLTDLLDRNTSRLEALSDNLSRALLCAIYANKKPTNRLTVEKYLKAPSDSLNQAFKNLEDGGLIARVSRGPVEPSTPEYLVTEDGVEFLATMEIKAKLDKVAT